VRWYGARGYWQIKIYNSMNPAWVPAMTKEAHLLGMRVAGHIPAFSTTDQMIEAGYDEITHINQFMLGWVIKPDEDTRTLFRLTALKRFGALDLQSDKVQHTINMMVERHIAIDPTLGIHEMLTQNRDGQVPPGAADYFDHMPIGWRRDSMKALIDTSAKGDDKAYRDAFDKIIATVRCCTTGASSSCSAPTRAARSLIIASSSSTSARASAPPKSSSARASIRRAIWARINAWDRSKRASSPTSS
jgi:hypothetical protein